MPPTFILSDILQGEGQSCVLSLHYAHLSECTFSYYAEELEVVEIHCGEGHIISRATAMSEGMRGGIILRGYMYCVVDCRSFPLHTIITQGRFLSLTLSHNCFSAGATPLGKNRGQFTKVGVAFYS